MTTSSWSYLVLKKVGNTGGLSLILLWRVYLTTEFSDNATWKSQKPLITNNACKMKNIWSVCKKLQSSIKGYSFLTTFVKFICIFENGSLVSLFWQWPVFAMIIELFYTPPKLVIVRRTIAISGSTLPLWKKKGKEKHAPTNDHSSFNVVYSSTVFSIANNVRRVKL